MAPYLRHTTKLTRPLNITTRRFSSKTICPFQTLGLTSQPTYEQARAAFHKLALMHHPDTANNATSSHSKFQRIKEAFDAIVEGPDGMAVLRDGGDLWKERDNGNDTNTNSESNNSQDCNSALHSTSMNPSILREVAQVADMSPGGLDKGGMWQYANMIRNLEKEGKLPPLQVEGVVDEKRRRSRRKK